MGGWLQFGRGDVGWERRRRRNRGRECRQMGGYIMVFFDGITDNGFFWWNHQRIPSVDDSISDSIGDSATSLYGYLSLNPSVIPSIKSSNVTTSLHISRQNIYPSAKWLVYTDKIFPSVYTNRFADGSMSSVYSDRYWDGKISSIISLIFSDFLVVS